MTDQIHKKRIDFWQCQPIQRLRGCQRGDKRKRKQIMSQMLRKIAVSSVLKICDSVLEPSSHSEPKEEARSHHAPQPPLNRRFTAGPAHTSAGQARLSPAVACRSETMNQSKGRPNQDNNNDTMNNYRCS